MKVGGYRKIRVSPHLGYGEFGLPEYGIPPHAVLIVKIWLHSIRPKTIHKTKDPNLGFDPQFFSSVTDACVRELQSLGLHRQNRTSLSVPFSANFSGWVYLLPSVREQRNLLNIAPMIGIWFTPHLQVWNELMKDQIHWAPICGWIGHLMPDDSQKHFALSADNPIETTAQELAAAIKQYGFPFIENFAQLEPYVEHIRRNGSKCHNARMLATLYYVLKDKDQMLAVIENQEREGKNKNRQDKTYKEFLKLSKKFLDYVEAHPISQP